MLDRIRSMWRGPRDLSSQRPRRALPSVFAILFATVAFLALPIVGRAGVILSEDDLPPRGGLYGTSTFAHGVFDFASIIPDVIITLTGEGRHQVPLLGISSTQLPPLGLGPFDPGFSQMEVFTSSGSFEASIPGFPNVSIQDGSIATTTIITLLPPDPAHLTTRFYDTQMVRLDINGTSNGVTIELRIEPGNPSPGSTSIMGLGGGVDQRPFLIDSFFDLTSLQMRVDPGTGFTPFVTCNPCPTVVLIGVVAEPSTLALLATGLSVLTAACLCRRRSPQPPGPRGQAFTL